MTPSATHTLSLPPICKKNHQVPHGVQPTLCRIFWLTSISQDKLNQFCTARKWCILVPDRRSCTFPPECNSSTVPPYQESPERKTDIRFWQLGVIFWQRLWRTEIFWQEIWRISLVPRDARRLMSRAHWLDHTYTVHGEQRTTLGVIRINVAVEKAWHVCMTRRNLHSVCCTCSAFNLFLPLSTGISMHKGYAFVQFTNPFDARSACIGEDGRNLSGQLLGT